VFHFTREKSCARTISVLVLLHYLLPLEKAQQELLDWQGKGLSIMEMSHRSADYVAVAEKAEADLRKLMNIPENYKVLFLQGGASFNFQQFL
jgi:phosphoserine aminotransferase